MDGVMGIRLADLAGQFPDLTARGDLTRDITGIAQDSRRVRAGDLFACIRGGEADGHDYAGEALARGAAAFLVEEWLPLPHPTPQLRTADVRRTAARLAARLNGDPSSRLRLIGVTGTNGKTTVTYLIEAILATAGAPTGRIGTIDYSLIGETLPSTLTTPEAPELQAMLRHIAEHGGRYAVLEASSHALAVERLVGCEFDVGVFTNLSHDHLDFHRDRVSYLQSKAMLFTGLGRGAAGKAPQKGHKAAVINMDDPTGREIAARTPVPVLYYGLAATAHVRAEAVTFAGLHTRFTLVDRRGEREERAVIDLPLPGLCNVYNALAAAGAALAEGIPLPLAAEALSSFRGVPGRYEPIDAGGGVTVLIDYAHNPDGLRHILNAARRMAPGDVISLFGGRGRRDRHKRPQMGRIAAELADRCIITSDDPYDEDPDAIIRDILEGVIEGGMSPGEYQVIPDRARAIAAALEEAGPGSMVVITGKGHEQYRMVGSRRIPYNDRDTVMSILTRSRRQPVT